MTLKFGMMQKNGPEWAGCGSDFVEIKSSHVCVIPFFVDVGNNDNNSGLQMSTYSPRWLYHSSGVIERPVFIFS